MEPPGLADRLITPGPAGPSTRSLALALLLATGLFFPAASAPAWVLTGMAGAFASAWVAERILPSPDFDTLV